MEESSFVRAQRYSAMYGFSGRDASLFLLDWRWSMVQQMKSSPSGENERTADELYIPLTCALRAVIDTMKRKIISSDSDLIGVVAFGAAQEGQLDPSSKVKWPGVRVILPLEKPSAEGIVKLIRLAKRIESGEPRALEAGDVDPIHGDPDFGFGKDEAVELQNALWAVRFQFSRRKVSSSSAKSFFNRCRVYLFTNDDDPSRGSASIKRLAARNANDLSDAGITIDVTFLKSRVDQVFNADLFYSDIVHVDGEEWHGKRGAISCTGISSLQSLHTVIRRKEIKKRARLRTVFTLGDGVMIGVAFYSMVTKATRPQKVKVRREDMKRLHQVRTVFCDATGESLRERDTRVTFSSVPFMKTNKSFKPAFSPGADDANSNNDELHADEDLSSISGWSEHVWGFTAVELKEIANIGRIGLSLYGFRDVTAFRQEDTLKAPLFIYPDEASFSGSSKLFAALHHSMLTMKKIAIASWRSSTTPTGPRFVTLFAQHELLDSEGLQIQPPGLRMFVMPFKNDIYAGWREMLSQLRVERDALDAQYKAGPPDNAETVPGLSVALALVSRLTNKRFSCRDYANPDLQRFHAGIEWEAGVSDGGFQPADDLLEPDDEALRKRAIVRVKGHSSADSEGTVDLLETFRQITMGDDFDGDEIAEQYGTSQDSKEKKEKQLKRKAEIEAKRSAALENIDLDEVALANKQGELQTFTNAVLKEFCVAVGLKSSGTKKVLIDRIAEYFDPDKYKVV